MKDETFDKIRALSPHVSDKNSYQELIKLTQQIIEEYREQGRLDVDPLESARNRSLSCPDELLHEKLDNSTCIISGGLGCIGTTLINELLKFQVRKIIVVDKKLYEGLPIDERVQYYTCDILDKERLSEIFETHQPEIIFHTAAQRDPGLAEKEILETIQTNIFGTQNMVSLAEKTPSVRHFVFSSTGKASRYFTEEIYAASKKICEYILETTSKKSKILYSMARFTHIVDNSLMDMDIKGSVMTKDYVRIHSPGKYVTAQNAKEAAYLMMNSLIYCDKGKCNFLIVRNLEWPTESLELALYYLSISDRKIPIIFCGNPLGYTEKFFRGQMDWSKPSELNLLINVYENQLRKINEAGDIIISNILECSESVLNNCLIDLHSATNKEEAKSALTNGLMEIVAETLQNADKKDTVSILNWGLDKKILEFENATPKSYGPIIPMMFFSLENTPFFQAVEMLLSL